MVNQNRAFYRETCPPPMKTTATSNPKTIIPQDAAHIIGQTPNQQALIG